MQPAMAKLSLRDAASSLFRQLSQRMRWQLYFSLVLMFVGALAELATIGAVIPFLAVAASGATRYSAAVNFVTTIGDALGLSTIATAAGILILIAVISAILRLALTWVSHEFVFSAARDLAVKIYNRMLHQPYNYHIIHNTSQTIGGLEKIQHVMAYVILPTMLAVTAAIMSLFIFIALICVDPVIAVGAGSCFVIIYVSISFFAKGKLHQNSDLIASALTERIQTVQEGLGGIRDVIIDRSQSIFVGKFAKVETRFRRSQSINYFVTAAPRFVVEASGMIVIAVFALFLSGRPGGLLDALPALGALALGAQRMLPLVQQVYVSWSNISGNRASLYELVELLEEPMAPALAGDRVVVVRPFEREIELGDVSYQYPLGDRPALHDISLKIERGERVGVVGKSGSGKSTLVDLLMGLLDPSAGVVQIDGRALDESGKLMWQTQISHVPQAIFLSDSSIAANIAFGSDESELDMPRVQQAAREAEVDEFIMTLPDGYATKVGERGVRLSGGQRQRLGIARALYKRAKVLLLDEATSALDDQTEASVMESISRLSSELTIIVIAHRLSTLRMCNRIVRLHDGRIEAIESHTPERVGV